MQQLAVLIHFESVGSALGNDQYRDSAAGPDLIHKVFQVGFKLRIKQLAAVINTQLNNEVLTWLNLRQNAVKSAIFPKSLGCLAACGIIAHGVIIG